MPHIVQGGKHVFGLSVVRPGFKVRLPLEAYYEYRLHEVKIVALVSGSETSGGFAIFSIDKLRHSRLSVLLDTLGYNAKKDIFTIQEASISSYGNRIISWLSLDDQAYFSLGQDLAGKLGIKESEKLVVIRGSNNGPAFINKGPVFEAAHTHPDLEVF